MSDNVFGHQTYLGTSRYICFLLHSAEFHLFRKYHETYMLPQPLVFKLYGIVWLINS